MKSNILGACCLCALSAGAMVRADAPATMPPEPYYGYYNDTDKLEGANLMLLKLDADGMYFDLLKTPADDPATGQVQKLDCKFNSYDESDGAVKIKGTLKNEVKSVFNGVPGPSSFSYVDFTLDWKKGTGSTLDTVVITFIPDDGKMPHSIHFQRRP